MITPLILGRQIFDGLGRQRSINAAGYTTLFDYREGQLPPTANTLADGKRVAFTYEPQLNNRLLSVTPDAEPVQRITYHRLGMPVSASGALGTEAFGFSAAGQPSQDNWTIDQACHETRWHYSLNGLLQGFDDSQGVRHRRSFDAQGRVTHTREGNLTSHYAYDALSRLVRTVVDDPDNQRTLTTTLTYDSLGRESTRTFTCTEVDKTGTTASRTVTQTLGYSAFDKIASRSWADNGQTGTETFEYDLRGRLINYAADESCAPEDPFGNRILRQSFTFNALDGHEKVVTRYADGSSDQALFTYAVNNPVQLVKVTHTHAAWPRVIRLAYDACGRVIRDSLGRRMVWNAQDRLTEVHYNNQRCQYRYTARGRLADRIVDGVLNRSFFSGDELTHELTGNACLQFHSGEQGLFAISKVAAGIRRTTLLGCDAQGSVRLEADDQLRTRHYTSHGAQAGGADSTAFGFAGQRREPLTGWQILGDYRPYDPVLMCFLSPDSQSPFGAGGINPYAYCAGDPVNRIDPDGHSWVNYALAGAGLAIGVASAIAGFGALLTVGASICYAGSAALTPSAMMVLAAGMLDLVSLGTGVAGLVAEHTGADQNVASVLGWVSLGTGLAAGALSGLSGPVARFAGRRARAPTPNLYRYHQTEVLLEHPPGVPQVTFHNRLWGDDLRGFRTHGSGEGYLLNAEGIFEPAANVARREIAPRLADYTAGRPLILLASEGGSSGAAQAMANVLRRPVVGYDKAIYVATIERLNALSTFTSPKGIHTNLPLQKIPFLKRLRGAPQERLAAGEHFELATWRTFNPA
ncbi:RHS repeat domain-containing protein [Pseudomonas sp. NPDC090201]|uniref:RHS repeat domain-containing protein n=1 Tax=Pseudomonas sp. NPDC090201 TaxID=3364475 RepID=UPI0038047AEC